MEVRRSEPLGELAGPGRPQVLVTWYMRVVLEELLALGNGVEAVEEELVVQMELAPMASAVARIVVLAVARMVAELQVVLQRHRSVAMVEITLLALEAASAMQTLAILELTAAVAPGDMINLAEGLVELGLTLLALWVAVAVAELVETKALVDPAGIMELAAAEQEIAAMVAQEQMA